MERVNWQFKHHIGEKITLPYKVSVSFTVDREKFFLWLVFNFRQC
jgi:hypothetical protein